jgi:predicted transcriptional regulator
MKNTKVRHSIWLDRETVRRLKIIAAAARKTQGDLVATALEVMKDGPLTDGEYEQLKLEVWNIMRSRPVGDGK